MLRTVTFFFMVVALSSCDFHPFEFGGRNRNRNNYELGNIDMYVAVYAAEDATELKVSTLAIRPTVKAGKIFVMGNKLFQVEENAGIHIIDYSDKAKPVKLAFLNVPGCKEVALQGSNVYTNNFEDMIVLDLSTYPDVKVKSRIINVFPESRHVLPPDHNYYSECIDNNKGRIVKWEVKKVNNPKCYAR